MAAVDQAAHPLFTVVVPTRNRPQLAVPTVKRLLEQTWTDFEILVLENSDEPSLSHLASLDHRIRVEPSSRVLSMPDNWQRGLELARGDYLLYISDKDWVVPYALAELADIIRAYRGPDVINVRRAVWLPPESGSRQGLVMQQGTGQIAVLPSKDAIHHWFHTANNQMNAPMIYNSAVRRAFATKVRARYGGRLFFGNSPDVGSGQLLLANTPTYVIFDRVLTMAVMGPWSIGWATLTKGAKGAAAGFAAEFGENPLDKYGLVWTLTGVVVETLLACQEAEPELLAGYKINWTEYCRLCLIELEKRSAAGEDTSADLVRLRTDPKGMYSKAALLSAWISWRFRTQIAQLRLTPVKFVMPPYNGWRRRLRMKPRGEQLPGAIGFNDSDCFRSAIPTTTAEEGFAYLLNDQQRLKPTATLREQALTTKAAGHVR